VPGVDRCRHSERDSFGWIARPSTDANGVIEFVKNFRLAWIVYRELSNDTLTTDDRNQLRERPERDPVVCPVSIAKTLCGSVSFRSIRSPGTRDQRHEFSDRSLPG
jgi:hypothetical protein